MKCLLSLSLLSVILLPFSLSSMENKPECDALHRALRQEDAKRVDYLLEQGVDANSVCILGYTPLESFSNNFASIMRLWKANRLPYSPNFEFFDHAIEKLLEYGADIYKKQIVFDLVTCSYVEKNSSYEVLKPYIPYLDDIIKKVEDKKKTKKLAADLALAAQNNLKTNRLITINGREFNLNEAVLSTRCPKLCLELNPDFKKEAQPQLSLPTKLFLPKKHVLNLED